MFGNMDLSSLSGMMEEMQKKAQEMQDNAASRTYEASSGGGMVKVTANGKGEVSDIQLDDALLEDKESLQILLMTAVNDALSKVEEGKKEMAMGMLGGLNPFAK